MKIAVVGASGHIGTYLVPRLVGCGHEVVALSRGLRSPYRDDPAWNRVTRLSVDRGAFADASEFARFVADLGAEVVVDIICFRPGDNRAMMEALSGRVVQFLHCGTIWVHGAAGEVPTPESARRFPFGDYGVRKAAIEADLLGAHASENFPATVIHPGHIVGPGWPPLNPQGNHDPAVFEEIARGGELPLPHLGLETVHHVHADDVAQLFELAIRQPAASIGQSFHAVARGAITLRGYAEAVYGWFGHQPKLKFLPWADFEHAVGAELAADTLSHISRSPHCSMEKAERLLGYQPAYSCLEAVREALGAIPSLRLN